MRLRRHLHDGDPTESPLVRGQHHAVLSQARIVPDRPALGALGTNAIVHVHAAKGARAVAAVEVMIRNTGGK